MLRRFDQFQWGPLNANRLNQLVDAVTRLQQRVDAIPQAPVRFKDRIMVRIEGKPTTFGEQDCPQGIPAVAYPFTQVEMTIAEEGPVGTKTCLRISVPGNAISSARGALLVSTEAEPSLKVGDIVAADRAPITFAAAEDKQVVYIPAKSGAAATVQLALVLAGEGGSYQCSLQSTGLVVSVTNLYETQGYYGALEASIECASITPKPLPTGVLIWVFPIMADGDVAGWMTMTPTAFDSICTCGPDGISALYDAEQEQAGTQYGKGGAAANAIVRMMGI